MTRWDDPARRQASEAYSAAIRSWDDCVQLLALSFIAYPDGLPEDVRRGYHRDLKKREAEVKRTEKAYLEVLKNEG